MKLWRFSGIFLILTGVLHTIVAILISKEIFADIITDGLINSIGEDYARNYAFWFLICGIFLLLFGQLLHYYIKKENRPAPAFFGYSLLVFTIAGCLIVPVSGFWLFLPQALIIIIANKRLK